MVAEIADLSAGENDELMQLVKDELMTGFNKDAVFAGLRQARIAEATNRIEAVRHIDGIGDHVLSVDVQAYNAWEKAQPGCWKDKGFRRWFAKTFPEAQGRKVITPNRVTVGATIVPAYR
jgi:hypothetical protein